MGMARARRVLPGAVNWTLSAYEMRNREKWILNLIFKRIINIGSPITPPEIKYYRGTGKWIKVVKRYKLIFTR